MRNAIPCGNGLAGESFVAGRLASKLASVAGLLVLIAWRADAALDPPTREALHEAYYEVEVAGYCGLVSDAVAAGFRRQVDRILADSVVAQQTLDEIRGKAWQAAHWEWQNRGLGGFRGWCRKQGKAAAERFLAEPRSSPPGPGGGRNTVKRP